jgi:hypothetical protein
VWGLGFVVLGLRGVYGHLVDGRGLVAQGVTMFSRFYNRQRQREHEKKRYRRWISERLAQASAKQAEIDRRVEMNQAAMELARYASYEAVTVQMNRRNPNDYVLLVAPNHRGLRWVNHVNEWVHATGPMLRFHGFEVQIDPKLGEDCHQLVLRSLRHVARTL